MILGNVHGSFGDLNDETWTPSSQITEKLHNMYPINFTLQKKKKNTYSEEDSSKSLSGLVKILENIFIKVEPSIISMFSSLFTILLTCSTILVILAELKICPSLVKFKISLATSFASSKKIQEKKKHTHTRF